MSVRKQNKDYHPDSLIEDSPNPFITNLDFEMKNKNKKLRHPQVDKVRRQLIREAPKRFKTSNFW